MKHLMPQDWDLAGVKQRWRFFLGYPVFIKKSIIENILNLICVELSTNTSCLRMKRITFELNDELHRKLKLLCYTESLSIGHILRQCVSDFCDKHDAHLIELIDKRSKWSLCWVLCWGKSSYSLFLVISFSWLEDLDVAFALLPCDW